MDQAISQVLANAVLKFPYIEKIAHYESVSSTDGYLVEHKITSLEGYVSFLCHKLYAPGRTQTLQPAQLLKRLKEAFDWAVEMSEAEIELERSKSVITAAKYEAVVINNAEKITEAADFEKKTKIDDKIVAAYDLAQDCPAPKSFDNEFAEADWSPFLDPFAESQKAFQDIRKDLNQTIAAVEKVIREKRRIVIAIAAIAIGAVLAVIIAILNA